MSTTPFKKGRVDITTVFLKKEFSHFSEKYMTPDMQKMSKNDSFHKNLFVAQNNLKSIKSCPQHHLKGFGLISGAYFSKKSLGFTSHNP